VKEYFNSLTGLRAFAAWGVFFHHFIPLRGDSPWYVRFITESHFGVALFFVLSGFLITYRYGEKFESGLRVRDLYQYFVNRAARIWPIYFLLTGLTLYAIGENSPLVWFLNFTFLKGFSITYVQSVIPQAWSLCVEEFFYILAPLCILVAAPISRACARTLKLRWEFADFFTMILFSTVFAGIGLALMDFVWQFDLPGFETTSFVMKDTIFGRGYNFFCGMLAAKILMGWREDSSSAKSGAWLTYFAFAGLISCQVALAALQGDGDYAWGSKTTPGLFVNFIVFPIFAGLFIYTLSAQSTGLQKFLGHKILVVLGKASYCFYLLHFGPFSSWLTQYTKTWYYTFIAMNLVSVALWAIVEEPANHFIRKIFSLKRNAPQVAEKISFQTSA
jgi:peptidoglycan/LPS O-acetylase OafA/YrhL